MRDEPMTHSSTPGTKEGITVLKLSGPLTMLTMFGFQNDFRNMKPKVLIVDLSETTYMDSAGLGLLVNYFVSAEDDGRKLLLTGVNDRIKALFEMTKVHEVLKCYPTGADAEASA
jgi:anti-anti-sigma factor